MRRRSDRSGPIRYIRRAWTESFAFDVIVVVVVVEGVICRSWSVVVGDGALHPPFPHQPGSLQLS